jgi:hypothetical protein
MSAEPVYVVSWLRDYGSGFVGGMTEAQYIAQFTRDCSAVVAELIEADKEFDAAVSANIAADLTHEQVLLHLARVGQARERRAAALARVQGESHGH